MQPFGRFKLFIIVAALQKAVAIGCLFFDYQNLRFSIHLIFKNASNPSLATNEFQGKSVTQYSLAEMTNKRTSAPPKI